MIVLYNKVLWRFLAFVVFLALLYSGWAYFSESYRILGKQGLYDALAIFSFVISAYLVLLIAEVADSHYLRAFAYLITLIGFIIGYKFLWQDSAQINSWTMYWALWVFLLGAVVTLALWVIIVARLIVDRLTYGRPVVRTEKDEFAAAPTPPAQAGASPATSVGRGPIVAPPPFSATTCPYCGEEFDSQGKCACTRFEAVSAQPPISPQAPAPVQQAPTPKPYVKPARMTCVAGPAQGTVVEFEEGKEIPLGRTEGAALLSADKQVSRRHCSITVGDRVTITDAGSTNGTWVNRQRVSTVDLSTGDTVQLGASVFNVE
jgi:hypothetical protein